MVHENFVALAKRLIEKNGRSITLYRQSETAATPASPWRGPDLTSPAETVTLTATILPPRATGLGLDYRDREDTVIRDAEMVALIATSSAGSSDITNFDSLVDGSTAWKILRVEHLDPGPRSIMFVVWLGA